MVESENVPWLRDLNQVSVLLINLSSVERPVPGASDENDIRVALGAMESVNLLEVPKSDCLLPNTRSFNDKIVELAVGCKWRITVPWSVCTSRTRVMLPTRSHNSWVSTRDLPDRLFSEPKLVVRYI